MLLSELVKTAGAVASTSSRNAKVESLAGLIRKLEPEEIGAAVGLLSGVPAQGKIGVGWTTVFSIETPSAHKPSLGILELDQALIQILESTGPGSSGRRTTILKELLAKATAEEGYFIKRILVGELRQGALAGLMTDAVAKAAGVPAAALRHALMLRGDLGETARIALTEGEKGLAAVGLEVLRPLQPMLASTAASIGAAVMETGLASVEWKLDGVRIQVHRRKREVRVFTRNLNDITARVPELVAVASEFPAETFVLDGEAIGFDETGAPQMFQETMGGIGRKNTTRARPMTVFFFDCLHLDGTDLIERPLTERIAALEKAAPGRRIPGVITSDAAEAQRVLDEALSKGHEGVMVKAAESVYQAGRRGKAWKKVKPVKTLDLVVLAAEWGHGRRQGRLSNLHLGARASGKSGGFVMVGKTFKGLTDEMLGRQTVKLLSLETQRSGITVFVRPELVVEIALDGVQISTRYPGGVALRFARVKRYREDMRAANADTIDTVRSMLPGSR
jgi:DNA ligase-1